MLASAAFVLGLSGVLRSAFADDDYDCGLSSATSNRVVSGKPVKDGEWPFIAAIVFPRQGDNRRSLCTGSIISRHHIVTAGHCANPGSNTTVFFGGPNRRNDAGVAVKSIYRHELYNPDKASWTQPDIGILELEHPIDFNNVTGRVCLPKVYKEEAGAQATVIGWGDDSAVEKYKLNKTVAEWNSVAFYVGDMCADGGIPKFNSSVYICAGGYNTGTEQGDSGGPLVSNLKGRTFLLGLTSAGKQVNDPEGQYDLGAYTRVAFLCEWIEKTTKGEAKCLDADSQPPVKAS